MEDAPTDHAPRPFCSAPCKLGDLDDWLSERVRIPAEESGDAPAPPLDGPPEPS